MTPATENIVTVDHFINGEITKASNYRYHNDPGKLSAVVASVANGTADDAEQAIQAAHNAYLSWRNVEPRARVEMMMKAGDILDECAKELAPLLVREHGGMLWEAQADFALGKGVLQHTASLAETFLEPVNIDDDQCTIRIEKRPRGVVAAIVPWNMPVVLTMMKLAPALATGNTLVLKPSPFASAALTIALQRIAVAFPRGVINVVHGDLEVGERLTSHPLVRKIGFTGGTATARAVMKSAAKSIKNFTLELGGNDPAIVLDDADIGKTLDRMLPGIFTRSGQICFAVKRIYVPRAMHDQFVDSLCDRVSKFVVGHGLSDGVNFGPLATEAQYHNVRKLIDTARASDAQVVELGRLADGIDKHDGYYVLPHIVIGASHTDQVSCCEQFGPIIPIIAYDDEEQVVEWANDTEYGLGSSIWTSSGERGMLLASRIEAGSTFINSHSFESLDLRMPFGGIKLSGIGREFGEAGMGEYIEEHAIRLLK
ncbi:aldehyde dehydrogenase family protein [Vreelandella glaciei]|jgi:acyl-CoA reductase-like NAD-dependent aldehyde dehydrogenase|uniref:aldehyde dehydrogenase family protein n=1 Tax=Vreelandella glaciei TaxID=186761 RepID=UPI000C0F3BE4|nr:aldehyde dehydrogenase family protein [Halomonas sp.]MBL1267554.1 aldehyde dehydrogenase family protein [Halomonas sp.]|tara:strand:+ start:14755 stop:16209 length:1455 start_codon:yes stop_codon:yes gene_type:complete